METISFNKTGYDPFIDFIKAYAIIFVVVSHSFPSSLWNYCLFQVWADMQVPMFILIQVFHAYKKGVKPILNWNSLLKRICIPFIAVQAVILGFKSLTGGGILWLSFISSGGYGPGSYYFWIYIQMSIILVLIWPLIIKLNQRYLILLFLLLSIVCEVIFSIIHLPDEIYRLLAVRYLFLIPLALPWINEGVVLNKNSVLLSIISIGAVIFFSFYSIDLEPFFFNTEWSFHRWLCYFYLPVLLTYALWIVFKMISKSACYFSLVKVIANSSYEIYLIQMLVFVVLPYLRLDLILYSFIYIPIWIFLTLALSIMGGIIFKKMMKKYKLV